MSKANRVAMGETVLALAKKDPRIVIVEADMSGSVNFGPFIEAFPERHFDCGIAEQNMIGVAAGLATCGYIPFTATFAVFASMRALDQVRNALCYNHFKVVVVGSHAGIETGPDGATHQAIEDIAIMRALPGMTVLVPSTPMMTACLTEAAAYCEGPVYLRLGRDKLDELYPEGTEFPIGGSRQLTDGKDVTVMAVGTMVHHAMTAAEKLKEMGVGVRVVDMYSIKPIDREAVETAARETGHIVTVEDHSVIGGLGGAVGEIIAELGKGRLARVGIYDKMGKAGQPQDLFKVFGLMPEDIVSAVLKLLN
ncbi:MAG: transketolase C-terminal domain-containing protein [Bacillota bacterium]|jgi:transketolase